MEREVRFKSTYYSYVYYCANIQIVKVEKEHNESQPVFLISVIIFLFRGQAELVERKCAS